MSIDGDDPAAPGGNPNAARGRSGNRRSPDVATSLEDALNTLIDHCDSGDAQSIDAYSKALLTVIGSGPAVAVLDSMIAANQANSLMYASSVAQQQRTNVLGMVAMTQCVARLLEGPSAPIDLGDLTRE
jgi:hypothetical protein